MKKTLSILLLSISSLVTSSCEDLFEYSPYAINFSEENRSINNKSISKIISKTNTDSIITIAFTGDTHRSFDFFDEYVNSVNKLNKTKSIDFVVHVGDIADFGLPKQYIWGNSYLLKLDVPYIVVLGNHDLVGNGAIAYSEMFGDFNFSFIYKHIKFISINTNSREFNFNGKVPDIDWLDSELTPNKDFKQVVILFHIPPMDGDFDNNLEEAFVNTLSKYNNVILTVHGHLHHFDRYSPYNNGIEYLNVYSVDKQKYNVLEIGQNSYHISTYDY